MIFATDEARDTATFAASNELPAGIDHVLVNGVEVVSEGAWNGRVAGQMLRRASPDSVKTDPGYISYRL